MILPAAEHAVIDPPKIRDYLLSTAHPVGRFKAAFFTSLGYSSDNWRRLEADLRELAVSGEAEPGRQSPHGRKYEVRGILKGPAGRPAEVATIWIVSTGRDVPEFVTAYPEGKA